MYDPLYANYPSQDIVHGFTDLYSLYVSRIYQTDLGILFELEDFLGEKTRYINLFHSGSYHYSIHSLQNLEFEGRAQNSTQNSVNFEQVRSLLSRPLTEPNHIGQSTLNKLFRVLIKV